jgi:starch synthase
MAPLRILLVSAEVAPFAKTGGLADVSAAIARFLARAGHDVRLVMPMYSRVRQAGREFRPVPRLERVDVPLGRRTHRFSGWTAPLPDSQLDVLFLRCPELYDRDGIYTSDQDEHVRFAFLSRAALVACQWLGWSPHIAHCNDWHTALLPLYLRVAFRWDRLLEHTRTVLTIHNIGYQGVFPSSTLDDLDLTNDRHLLYQEDLSAERVNFLKTGLLYADALTTVSETDFLFGIVNGIDPDEWNPATDELIPHRYTADDLSGKARNKEALVRGFDLRFDPAAPVIGIVSRLTAQKGFDLLPGVLPRLLEQEDARLIALGSGDEQHERWFQSLRDAHPARVAYYRGYNEELAHRIEAGSDVFLMPSRYEPCGLNQMYSQRYGTVPVVRRTGGLADTVRQFDARTGEGTGFLFDEYSSEALQRTLRECLAVYRRPQLWQRLVRAGMQQDFSWQRQGQHYVRLYERLVGG